MMLKKMTAILAIGMLAGTLGCAPDAEDTNGGGGGLQDNREMRDADERNDVKDKDDSEATRGIGTGKDSPMGNDRD